MLQSVSNGRVILPGFDQKGHLNGIYSTVGLVFFVSWQGVGERREGGTALIRAQMKVFEGHSMYPTDCSDAEDQIYSWSAPMRAKILLIQVHQLTQVPRNTSEFVGTSHVTNSGCCQYSLHVRSAEW